MRLLRRTPSERTGLPRLWRREAVAQGTVWPDPVDVLPPSLDERLGLKQRVKRFPFQLRLIRIVVTGRKVTVAQRLIPTHLLQVARIPQTQHK